VGKPISARGFRESASRTTNRPAWTRPDDERALPLEEKPCRPRAARVTAFDGDLLHVIERHGLVPGRLPLLLEGVGQDSPVVGPRHTPLPDAWEVANPCAHLSWCHCPSRLRQQKRPAVMGPFAVRTTRNPGSQASSTQRKMPSGLSSSVSSGEAADHEVSAGRRSLAGPQRRGVCRS